MRGEDINADNIAEYFKKLSAEQQSQVARMIALWADYSADGDTRLGIQTASRQPKHSRVKFGVAKGKFKRPDDINAYDEEAARAFCEVDMDEELFSHDDLDALDVEAAKMFLRDDELSRSMFVPKRQPGILKGKIKMADDFDEPLEEFAGYV